MCGICGRFNFNNDALVDKGLIQRMTSVLKHRGPDDEGIYISEHHRVGLGHRRLSIIDLSPAGHQPMSNEDGSIWITYNGEIYNYIELKEDLIKKGHQFKSRTDTEVIIHLYEEDSENCVKRLRGMFAFAIWDEKKNKLFLARDRVGKKPLVYTINNGGFIFASEIKSIVQDPTIEREVDLEALHYYLTYLCVPAPMTMFKGIKKLPPAHTLVCQKNDVKIERYWDLSYLPKVKMREKECEERILDLLKEATRLRLMSDVPLGAFLSGGIDSSAVVGMMSQLMDRPVKTFSIGFEEESYNELEYARIIAKHFKTDHHEFIVRPNAIEILPKLIWYYSEPFADSSAIPSYYVSKMARELVAVALNGDGGDESFAGYYGGFQSISDTPFQRLLRATNEGTEELLGVQESRDFGKKVYQVIKNIILMKPNVEFKYPTAGFLNEEKIYLYSKEMLLEIEDIESADIYYSFFNHLNTKYILDKYLYTDVMLYLPEDLLVKMDIASMANSLEARSPFLDHQLMEFAAKIPPNFKLNSGITKYILKKALSKILPNEILTRNKWGFGVPMHQWLRNELKNFAYDTLLDHKVRAYFNTNNIKRILDEHISKKFDHRHKIWALLNFELWHQMFIDNEKIEEPSMV